MRLGLCCQFAREPIKFLKTTASTLMRLSRREQLERLSDMALANARALMASIDYCASHGIGAFRVTSQILPVKTHPIVGYDVAELPGSGAIIACFGQCRASARAHDVRLTFHPDQFVVLNSPNPATQASSVAELVYQAETAQWVGADTINIHGGGAYGDKAAALGALCASIERLPDGVRSRLTVENDDRLYTPFDLLPVCTATGVPLVYDVHHHRCLPDRMGVAEATERARATWDREPLFHLSSPLEGWLGPRPERHHDYVAVTDLPQQWLGWPLTVEIEAKAKELAVLSLLDHIERT